LDGIDRAVIRLLRHDVRLSVSAPAIACGVSRGKVQNRRKQPKDAGTIPGNMVRLRADAAAAPVRAETMVEVAGGKLTATMGPPPRRSPRSWCAGPQLPACCTAHAV